MGHSYRRRRRGLSSTVTWIKYVCVGLHSLWPLRLPISLFRCLPALTGFSGGMLHLSTFAYLGKEKSVYLCHYLPIHLYLLLTGLPFLTCVTVFVPTCSLIISCHLTCYLSYIYTSTCLFYLFFISRSFPLPELPQSRPAALIIVLPHLHFIIVPLMPYLHLFLPELLPVFSPLLFLAIHFITLFAPSVEKVTAKWTRSPCQMFLCLLNLRFFFYLQVTCFLVLIYYYITSCLISTWSFG